MLAGATRREVGAGEAEGGYWETVWIEV
jgi:hypothetical protein